MSDVRTVDAALRRLARSRYDLAMDWVVFDLETTGLSVARDGIIQIAAMRLRDGRRIPEETFFSYVNPGRRIPSWITEYTGVRDSDVARAPDVAEVLKKFSLFTGGSTLVAHNGHRFDMPFLTEACSLHRLPTRAIEYHDSLALSWKVFGRGGRHGLDAVIRRLELANSVLGRHDARGDVDLLARAVESMWQRLSGLNTPVELRKYSGVLPQL